MKPIFILFLAFQVFFHGTAFSQFFLSSVEKDYIDEFPLGIIKHDWRVNAWNPILSYHLQYGPTFSNIVKTQVAVGTNVPISRSTQTFDASGHLLSALKETYQSAWVPMDEHVCHYDAQGTRIYAHIFQWITAFDTTTIWVNNPVYTPGNQLAVENWMSGVTLSALDSAYRITYFYGSNGETDSIRREVPPTSLSGPWTVEDVVVYNDWHNFQSNQPDTAWHYAYFNVFNGPTLIETHTYAGNRRTSRKIDWRISNEEEYVFLDSLGYIIQDCTISLVNQTYGGIKSQYNRDHTGTLLDIVRTGYDGVIGMGGTSWNDSKDVISYINTSSPTAPSLAGLSLGPNPATDRLRIVLPMAPLSPTTIRLYDLQGRVRMLVSDPIPSAEMEIRLSDALEAGIYVVEVMAENGKWTGKVMVQ